MTSIRQTSAQAVLDDALRRRHPDEARTDHGHLRHVASRALFAADSQSLAMIASAISFVPTTGRASPGWRSRRSRSRRRR